MTQKTDENNKNTTARGNAAQERDPSEALKIASEILSTLRILISKLESLQAFHFQIESTEEQKKSARMSMMRCIRDALETFDADTLSTHHGEELFPAYENPSGIKYSNAFMWFWAIMVDFHIRLQWYFDGYEGLGAGSFLLPRENKKYFTPPLSRWLEIKVRTSRFLHNHFPNGISDIRNLEFDLRRELNLTRKSLGNTGVDQSNEPNHTQSMIDSVVDEKFETELGFSRFDMPPRPYLLVKHLIFTKNFRCHLTPDSLSQILEVSIDINEFDSLLKNVVDSTSAFFKSNSVPYSITRKKISPLEYRVALCQINLR